MMKKEKVGLIVALVITTLVLFFGLLLAVKTMVNERSLATKAKRIEELQGISASQLDQVKGDSILLVIEEHYLPYELVGSEYVLFNEYERTLGEGTQKLFANLQVKLFDLESLTLEDIYEPAELVGKTLKAEFAFTSPVYVTAEKEELAVNLINLDSDEKLVAKFNADFRTVSFAAEEEQTQEKLGSDYFPFLDGDFLENQGLDYEFMLWSFEENKFKLAFKGNHLPEKNKRLYQLFPILKDYQQAYEQKFELTMKEKFSFEDLLALFKEEGDSVFTPYQMAEYAAKDSRPHQINNLADYQKWARIYEEMDRVEE